MIHNLLIAILLLLSPHPQPYPENNLAPPPINFTTVNVPVLGEHYKVKWDGKKLDMSKYTRLELFKLWVYKWVCRLFIWVEAGLLWGLIIAGFMGEWNAFRGFLGLCIIVTILGIYITLNWSDEE